MYWLEIRLLVLANFMQILEVVKLCYSTNLNWERSEWRFSLKLKTSVKIFIGNIKIN